MTPADRVEIMFWLLLAIGCTVGAVILFARACLWCRVWWGS